jgi:N-acyl-D-aspartate/D-glutamate deacylase
MGERGGDHAAEPSPAECAQMTEIVADAMRAGAFGFSTARTVKHFAGTVRAGPQRPPPPPPRLPHQPNVGGPVAFMRLGGRVVQVVACEWVRL